MKFLLASDDTELTKYQAGLAQAIAEMNKTAGSDTVFLSARSLREAPKLDAAEFAADLLKAHSDAHVHLLTDGPFAAAVAETCCDTGRLYSSTWLGIDANCAEISTPGSLDTIHPRAASVFTPSQRVATELLEIGIQSCEVVTAGVDPVVFQPRRYGNFELPRPLLLMLSASLESQDLQEFIATPVPGTKIVYAPGWTGPAEIGDSRVRVVSFLPKDELAELISAADVCVAPGNSADTIVAALHGLACGVPVAARSSAYIDDLLAEPTVGCSSPDLGRAITGALRGNRQLSRSLGRRCSWQNAARRILSSANQFYGAKGFESRAGSLMA